LSHLYAVGEPGLITSGPEEYIAKAVTLAQDIDYLSDLRSRLRGQMSASPLCDGIRFTRNLEAAYRDTWKQWCTKNEKQITRVNTMQRPFIQRPFIMITAADANFFELVKGTILSIRQKAEGGNAAIAFIDLGCTGEQLVWLKEHVDTIKKVDWPFDFPDRDKTPEYLKGLLARAFLREHFPGFDVYCWIDADAWIQDWRAIELFIAGANSRGLAIVPEIDRGSLFQYGELPHYWKQVHGWYNNCFGEKVAEKLCSYPMLNAGVFALHKDAPHWEIWSKNLYIATRRGHVYMTDQISMNFAVYGCGLFNKTEMLPAWCNWTCHLGCRHTIKKVGALWNLTCRICLSASCI
jgi:hypothetical protein